MAIRLAHQDGGGVDLEHPEYPIQQLLQHVVQGWVRERRVAHRQQPSDEPGYPLCPPSLRPQAADEDGDEDGGDGQELQVHRRQSVDEALGRDG